MNSGAVAVVVLLISVVLLVGIAKNKSESDKLKAKAAQNRAEGVRADCAGLRMTATELIEDGPVAVRHSLAGLTAHVEDAGELRRRITATRLATIGIFALAAQKTVDGREVYLSVYGPRTAILRTIAVKDSPKAHIEASRFAAAVNQRSQQLAAH